MLTPRWTPLRYHELQNKLYRTKARFCAVAAGRGSGKTELARRRVVRFLAVRKPWPDPIYFYALPTIATAKRIAWKAINDLIPADWIRKINISDMTIETIFGSTLYVLGMDKPQRAEGVQWDGGILDEACDQKPGTFNLSILPALSHRNAWCWQIGVPKRFGPGARDFKDFFDKGLDPERPKNANGYYEQESYTWPSSTVLTEEKLEYAKATLDARDFDEQYNATWADATGAIFYAFNEKLNISDQLKYHANLPLLIGTDFNVDPMCWVIGQLVEDNKKLYIIDELFIRNTNTQATLNELFKKYGSHTSGFNFYGDASSRARKTSASSSDYLQIANDKRFRGLRVYFNRANPRIADRFAACNAMFCNTLGERRCLIHARCKYLIKDLLDRAYEEGTNQPNDYGDIGHSSDALGYPIHRLFPIRVILTDKLPQVHMHVPNRR